MHHHQRPYQDGLRCEEMQHPHRVFHAMFHAWADRPQAPPQAPPHAPPHAPTHAPPQAPPQARHKQHEYPPAAPGCRRMSTGRPCRPRAPPRHQQLKRPLREGHAGLHATANRRREYHSPTPTTSPLTPIRRALPWTPPGRGTRRRCIPSRCRPGRGAGWAPPHHRRTRREHPPPSAARRRATTAPRTTRATPPPQHNQTVREARACPQHTPPASP